MSRSVKPILEVCLSPALLHLYDTRDRIVVIVDVFRATSSIAAALGNGALEVIPVASVQECIRLGSRVGCISAGERNGKIANGLAYGNSPLVFSPEVVKGKKVALTTTNGTRLLHMIKECDRIVTGSFLNLTALCDYLAQAGRNVIIACASWRDRLNMEDSLFAGAVVSRMATLFQADCDSALMAKALHERSEGRYEDFLRNSSHFKRLSGLGLQRDISYCVAPDLHPVVPVLVGSSLVPA